MICHNRRSRKARIGCCCAGVKRHAHPGLFCVVRRHEGEVARALVLRYAYAQGIDLSTATLLTLGLTTVSLVLTLGIDSMFAMVVLDAKHLQSEIGERVQAL